MPERLGGFMTRCYINPLYLPYIKHPTKRYTQHVQMQLTAAAAMTLAQATGLLQL